MAGSDTQLKPCPFCGGTASSWRKGYKGRMLYWIECAICGAKGKAHSISFEESKGKNEWDNAASWKALLSWNHRDESVEDRSADRFEERRKLETVTNRNGFGHAAMMRVALVRIVRECDAVLSTPPRNCDRGREAAEDAFTAEFGRPWTEEEARVAAWLFEEAGRTGTPRQDADGAETGGER